MARLCTYFKYIRITILISFNMHLLYNLFSIIYIFYKKWSWRLERVCVFNSNKQSGCKNLLQKRVLKVCLSSYKWKELWFNRLILSSIHIHSFLICNSKIVQISIYCIMFNRLHNVLIVFIDFFLFLMHLNWYSFIYLKLNQISSIVLVYFWLIFILMISLSFVYRWLQISNVILLLSVRFVNIFLVYN